MYVFKMLKESIKKAFGISKYLKGPRMLNIFEPTMNCETRLN